MNKNVFLSIIGALLIMVFTCHAFGEVKTKDRQLLQEDQTQNQPKDQVQDQKLITLNYRDMDIRDAFSSLAMEFKINIVLSNEVQGAITLHLFGMSIEDALATIAMAGGYTYKKTGDMHHIYKASAEEQKPIPEPVETQMKIFKASFVEIDKVKETLDAVPGLNPIDVHESTKTIIVNDTPENIKKIEEIFSVLDSVPKQVLIEAKIIKVNLDESMIFGVDWQAIMTDGIIQTSGLSTALLPGATKPITSPVPASGTGLFANFVAGVGSSSQIAAAIDLLQTQTDLDVVATPKILAVHGKEAKIRVGGEQGYRLTTTIDNVTTESIEFIDTGTILEITAYIDENENILLYVKPSLSSVTISLGIPKVTSTTASTWLLAKDGETIFIAGLIETIDIQKEEGIPLLGDIPVLGYLFKRTEDSVSRQELVIMITPTIIKNSFLPPPKS